MADLTDEILLNPETEAKRLWQEAKAAFKKAGQNVSQLGFAMDSGIRAIEITTAHFLQPIRDRFSNSIASLLESPPPEVDPQRDFLHPPKSFEFIDALDLLSSEGLPCISPMLHRGWEDRRKSCQRARASVGEIFSVSLEKEQRDALMVLGAYRNRIFLLSPPVKIVPQEILNAFPELNRLAKELGLES